MSKEAVMTYDNPLTRMREFWSRTEKVAEWPAGTAIWPEFKPGAKRGDCGVIMRFDAPTNTTVVEGWGG